MAWSPRNAVVGATSCGSCWGCPLRANHCGRVRALISTRESVVALGARGHIENRRVPRISVVRPRRCGERAAVLHAWDRRRGASNGRTGASRGVPPKLRERTATASQAQRTYNGLYVAAPRPRGSGVIVAGRAAAGADDEDGRRARISSAEASRDEVRQDTRRGDHRPSHAPAQLRTAMNAAMIARHARLTHRPSTHRWPGSWGHPTLTARMQWPRLR